MKPGDRINGKKGTYELIEALDRSYVFLARADGLYVVKGFAHPDIFEREAAAFRVIREAHPNIVRQREIIDGGYIILPYLRGEKLIERIRRDGPMPLETALGKFSEVCRGLAHLHSCGISHGDVSVDNIMLTPKAVLFDLDASDDDTGTDIDRAARTLHEMLTGRRIMDGLFEPACDPCLDSDILRIIENACTDEYKSIMDMWADLEDLA